MKTAHLRISTIHLAAMSALFMLFPDAPAALAQETATEPAPPPGARTLFSEITSECGVADVMERHKTFMRAYLAKIGNPEYKEWWFSGPTLVDLDGDGHLDLHLAGHKQYAILAHNDGKSHFTGIDGKFDIERGVDRLNKSGKTYGDIPFPGGEIRLACDLSANGKLDLLVSWDDASGQAYLNDTAPAGAGAGRLPTFNCKPHEFGFDAFSRAAAIVDINRDGLVDYMGTGDQGSRREFNTLDIALGRSEGKFEDGPKITVPKESGAIPVDINGDGLIDLLCSQRGYARTGPQTRRWILLNDPAAAATQPSSGGVAFTRSEDSGLSESGTIQGVGDFNQDGYLDLIGIDDDGGKLSLALYINNGKGHFTRQPLEVPEQPHYTNWGGAIVTDFDNDGVADIVVNGRNFLYFLRGLGGGKFELANAKWGLPTYNVPAVDEGISFGDIDGDGDLDVITCTPRARKDVAVYRNDTTGKHWLNVQLMGKKGNSAAAGSIIRLLDPRTGKLLWYEQVAIWGRQQFHSYYFAAHTERHFGLGERTAADVEVMFYPSGRKVTQKEVAADRTVQVRED